MKTVFMTSSIQQPLVVFVILLALFLTLLIIFMIIKRNQEIERQINEIYQESLRESNEIQKVQEVEENQHVEKSTEEIKKEAIGLIQKSQLFLDGFKLRLSNKTMETFLKEKPDYDFAVLSNGDLLVSFKRNPVNNGIDFKKPIMVAYLDTSFYLYYPKKIN
jgi:hypothetical protein